MEESKEIPCQCTRKREKDICKEIGICWRNLHNYGYAPGGYFVICTNCGSTDWDADKRATTCPECALKKFQEDLKKPKPSKKPSWHETYLELCDVMATRSDDLRTKLGCVIVGPDKEIITTGYNGLPRGIAATQDRLVAPAKYLYTEHAERNAILNATRFGAILKGCTLYCQRPPCADCARAIIQAGIKEIVIREQLLTPKWKDSTEAALEMLKEAKVSIGAFEPRGNRLMKVKIKYEE